MLGKYFV